MGDTKGGAFDIDAATALEILRSPNPSGRPSSDVVVPWVNGLDVTRRPRDYWIIDFGVEMPESEASRHEAAFGHVQRNVYEFRQKNKREAYRLRWWLHVEARPAMRRTLHPLPRFLATPTVAKHRLFVWITAPTLPDHQLITVARSDGLTFGILHSRFHEIWALSQGTQVREKESGFRYTPTTCFETFPFPDATEAQKEAISTAAAELNSLRERWLNPPEWTHEEVLTFPGSADGPWARCVDSPDSHGIGTVHYPRLRPADDRAAAELKKRTLTNLYNARPAWLQNAHRALDEAVEAAYGFPVDLPDDDLLARLLDLNQEKGSSSAPQQTSLPTLRADED